MALNDKLLDGYPKDKLFRGKNEHFLVKSVVLLVAIPFSHRLWKIIRTVKHLVVLYCYA